MRRGEEEGRSERAEQHPPLAIDCGAGLAGLRAAFDRGTVWHVNRALLNVGKYGHEVTGPFREVRVVHGPWARTSGFRIHIRLSHV